MFSYELRVPKERVAVIIGEKGSIRRKIERGTSTKIQVNTAEEYVTISAEDNLNVHICKDIVKAIARGFNPDIALRLLNEANIFEIVDIKEYSKKSRNKLIRLRSRVIGTDGKARKMIEQMTNTDISVYGKTVGIIGNVEGVLIAKNAVARLLGGSPHSNAYREIEDRNKAKKAINVRSNY